MAEFDKINEEELVEVSGGGSYYAVNGWMTVCRLQSGYLAMRTQPTYDYSNEIRGAELYNGDQVQVKGNPVQGTDGRTYVLVYSPKTGTTGYVNYGFLG